jgi:secondary thiamine-phosphate synthase enzyme
MDCYDPVVPSPPKTDTISVRSRQHDDVIDVTDRVAQAVAESGVHTGLCHIFVPHTTAGVFINENADPDVMADVLATLADLVPWENRYRHAEGNAAAHIKSTLIGVSQTIPVRNGRLALGRWQGIYFAEFDGPRERHFQVTVLG